MLKKISELTEQEKERFLERTKQAMKKEHGVDWAFVEKQMLDEMDATFDDEKFARMDPDAAIDAAYARKEFKGAKPSLVDYMLWMMKFTTKSEYVEIEDKQCCAVYRAEFHLCLCADHEQIVKVNAV